jgi:ATP-dependent DNA helicase RecG
MLGNYLIKHPSIPFNPDVANAFFRAGMIEAWGRGTIKIINDCRTAKIPVPSFRYDMAGFVVEFELPITNTQDNIINKIAQNGNITIVQLAKEIGVAEVTIKRLLKKMQDENIIKRDGSTKNGSWEVISNSNL